MHQHSTQHLGANDDLQHFLSDEHLRRAVGRERSCWLGGIFFALLLIAVVSWTEQKDENVLRAERQAELQAHLTRLGCPEKQAGDTDVITLTFDTSADLHTDKPFRATGCARYVERGWMRQQQRSKVAER